MSDKLDKLFKKALNKHKSKKYLDAEMLYKKVLRNDKAHLDANYMLGTLYAELDKPEPAINYLKIAEQINPESPYIQNNLGNVYRLQQRYENAASHYKKAISSKPDMAQALNNLGITLKQQGNTSQALEMYQQAILSMPDFIDAHYNCGTLYWDLNEFENALACFDHVLRLDPAHARSHDKLGSYYMNSGNYDKALAHFDAYLKQDDKDDCGVRMKQAYLRRIMNPEQDTDSNYKTLPDKIPETLVKETYERKAKNWDHDIARQNMEFLGPTNIQQAFNKYCADRQALNLLDLGCGTGLCGEFLQRHAKHLIGVDLSTHMLSQAQQKNSYHKLEHAEILHYLQNSSDKFDVIIGSGVLIFYGDLEPVLIAVRNRLNIEGLFIFTLYKSESKAIEVRKNIHFAHSAEYVQNIAQTAGFKLEMLSDVIHEYDYGIAQPGLTVVLKPI